MLSIAVCDDEMLDCCNMARDIKDILEEMQITCIIRQFDNGEELLHAAENFDIIFLDIMMDGMNGMRTAQLLREKAFQNILVFVSSSREYVFDAYDVEAFYYLMKPVDLNKLKNILNRAVMKLTQDSQDFIIINKERQNKKLFLKDIFYFEIMGRVVSVHSVGGLFDYYDQISVLEKNLRDKGFFRCHKSFLVNLKHVDTYNREEIILDNGEKIIVAKRRYEDFCKDILEFMKKSGGYM